MTSGLLIQNHLFITLLPELSVYAKNEDEDWARVVVPEPIISLPIATPSAAPVVAEVVEEALPHL